jgi:hypothetical protein
MIQRSPDEFDVKFQGFGLKNAAYAVLGGLPCIISRHVEVIRVSQVKIQGLTLCSRPKQLSFQINKREEFEPVSLMLLGTPGMFIVLPTQSLPIFFRVGFSLD